MLLPDCNALPWLALKHRMAMGIGYGRELNAIRAEQCQALAYESHVAVAGDVCVLIRLLFHIGLYEADHQHNQLQPNSERTMWAGEQASLLAIAPAFLVVIHVMRRCKCICAENLSGATQSGQNCAKGH